METDPTERQKALDEVHALVAKYNISNEELGVAPVPIIAPAAAVTSPESPAIAEDKQKEHLSVAETLYNVGAVVILSGAWALVGINWGELDNIGRIFSSLFVVVVTYLLGVGLSKVPTLEKVAPSMYLATIATLPIVVIAVLNALEIKTSDPSGVFIIALVSGLFSLVGWLIHRIALFTLGMIAYATMAYIALTQLFLDAMPPDTGLYDEFWVTAFVVLGLAYSLFAYLSTKVIEPLKVFKNALYGFGSLFILGSLFTQTGWSSQEVTVMEVLYPLVIFGGVIASALLKQSSILAVSTIFLIIYLIKTTFMYFSDNLGWPVALMLSGLLTVAIGIGANVLAKRLGMIRAKQ